MKKAELIERLKGYEWNDLEFKKAQRGVPENAYETVSAFSNTEGGWLVFGVQDRAGGYEIVGVVEVDKVQNDFLSVLRSGQRLNRVVAVDERLIEDDGKVLLVFHIPEARRQDKPVYLGGDIRKSFIRRGAGDERCTETEIERFLRDAADERYDGGTVDLHPERCFDGDSVRWYRETYERRPGNRSYTGLSDLDFLDEMGLLAERDSRRMPTRAAVLMFGRNAALRQLLPRPVVDCQRFVLLRDEADAGPRWIDRMVLDENLIRTWRALVDWYERFAERPFRIDSATFQRDDTPPDYLAYRESLVNLLIHQDYSDQGRKAEVRHYADQTVFWNPGDAFTDAADLIEPGEKEVRNPRIVTAFRRIGLSENAGWGLRDVFRNWQQLGNVPPRITNDKGRKCFELALLEEVLLSERQRLFQAQLGVHLTEEQARAFAFICRDGTATLLQLKAVTGLPAAEAVAVADRLVTQGLVERSDSGESHTLAEHLRQRLGDGGQVGSGPSGLITDQATRPSERLVTDQADLKPGRLVTDQARPEQEDLSTAQADGPSGSLFTTQADGPSSSLFTTQAEPLTKLSANQRKIIEICDVPHSLTTIMRALGVTGRGYFKRRHLDPLLRGGVLRMTHPDQPKHPGQAYVLTGAGARLKAVDGNKDVAKGDGDRTNGTQQAG